MANQSRSGSAHFSCLTVFKESIHEDRHLQSKVHKEIQGQPLQKLKLESCLLLVGIEVGYQHCKTILIQQGQWDGYVKGTMLALQQQVVRNEERLWRKDEELLHQKGPSLIRNHSWRDEHSVGERLKKQDRRQSPPYRERRPPPHHRDGRKFPPKGRGQFLPLTGDIEGKNYHYIGRSLRG